MTLAEEISESKKQIQVYQQRYGVSFTQFEAELLPILDTVQVHEDYNDWFFWETVLEKQTRNE